MNVSVSTSPTDNPNTFSSKNVERREEATSSSAVNELIFELGLWLSGLESFLQTRNQSFDDASRDKAARRDWAKEFYLTNSTLMLCSSLSLRLGKILRQKEMGGASDADFLEEISGQTTVSGDLLFAEVFDLSVILKDAILLGEALLRAAPLKFVEWTAWCSVLTDKLKQTPVTRKLIDNAERQGEIFLPQVLRSLLQNKTVAFAAEADLRMILPQFARILKWLDVIETQLKTDKPLKSSLLLFARINEQTQAMMSYINNRLRRFATEEDEFFLMLDSTVYAASIEVKKVYNFELVGLSDIRQTPSVRARIETAHGLLSHCFQQIVVNFAQLVEPQIQAAQLFPYFQTKLEQSIALRRDLWSLQRAVQNSERDLTTHPLEKLYQKLNDFQSGSMKNLFYKDLETVERFIEEILRTQSKTDVVPILHRFGAYLETLLGQVNMRTVLADHPFDYPKD